MHFLILIPLQVLWGQWYPTWHLYSETSSQRKAWRGIQLEGWITMLVFQWCLFLFWLPLLLLWRVHKYGHLDGRMQSPKLAQILYGKYVYCSWNNSTLVKSMKDLMSLSVSLEKAKTSVLCHMLALIWNHAHSLYFLLWFWFPQ